MELLQLDRDSFHHAVSTSSLDVFLDQLDQLISLSEPALVCLCLIILGRIQRRKPDVDSNAKAAESRLNAASLWLTQHVAEHPHPSRRLVMLVEEATKLSNAGWWLNEDDDKDEEDDDENEDDQAAAAITVPTTIYRRPWLETHRTFQIDELTIELTQRPVDRLDQTTPQAERTGMVVWNAAVVLAHAARNFLLKNKRHRRRHLRVLELGAGLGLPGLVAAATAKEVGVLSCEVVLTDLPGVLPETMSNMNTVAKALGLNTTSNMTSNKSKNKTALEGVASLLLKAAPLRWGNEEELSQALGGDREGVDLVLAADCVYFRESHTALVRTLGQVLQRGRRRKRRKEEVVEEVEEVEEMEEVLLSYKPRNVRIEKEFFQLLHVNGMRALDLPIPLSLQSKDAAKNIFGYDDELAFVGIKLMRVVMDLD